MKKPFRTASLILFLLGGIVMSSAGALLQMDILPEIQVAEFPRPVGAQLRGGIIAAERISFPHKFKIDSAHDVLLFKNKSTGKSVGIKYSNAQGAGEITPLLWKELTHAGLGEAEQFSWSYGSMLNQRIKAQTVWQPFAPAAESITEVTLPVFTFKDKGAVKSTGTTNRTLVAISKNIPIKYMTLPGVDIPARINTRKMAYTYELPDGRLSSIVSGGGALPSASLTVHVNEGGLPFTLIYDDDPNEGFYDLTHGSQRRAAMEYAVNIWASKLYGTVPVEIHASINSLDAGVLGEAGPLGWVTSEPSDTEFEHVNTLYISSLGNQLIGFDIAPLDGDIEITYSTEFLDEIYFGTDGNIPVGKTYDFVTIVLHELAHGLGFLDGMDSDGSYWVDDTPFVFDHFLYENGTHQIIKSSQNRRAIARTSGALYWDGSHAKAANGGAQIEMYAPSIYEPGSSVSHWDDEIPFNSFMAPRYVDVIHQIDAQLLGALRDMEWESGYPFDGWVVDENIPEGKRGPLDDPADDGIENIWKFAVGLNAMTPHTKDDIFSYALDPIEQTFSMTYAIEKFRPEAEIISEWTHMLLYNGWDTNGIITEKIGETASQETWKSTIPIDTKGFIRLRAKLHQN